jgi:hypothetical protein
MLVANRTVKTHPGMGKERSRPIGRVKEFCPVPGHV